MTTLKNLWMKLTGSSCCEGIKKHNLCLQNTPKKMIIYILRFWATTFTAPRLVRLICATCFADCMHTSSESSSTGRALPGQTEHSRGDSVSVTHTSQGTETLAAWGCSCFYLVFFFRRLHISERAGNIIFHPFQIFILEKQQKRMKKKGNAAICWTACHFRGCTFSYSSVQQISQPKSFNNMNWNSWATHLVCFRGLHWAICVTFRRSKLHTSWKKKNKQLFWDNTNLKHLSFLQ